MQYNSIAVGEAVSLCLEKMYVLSQYYLNPYVVKFSYMYNAGNMTFITENNIRPNLQFNQAFAQGP